MDTIEQSITSLEKICRNIGNTPVKDVTEETIKSVISKPTGSLKLLHKLDTTYDIGQMMIDHPGIDFERYERAIIRREWEMA